MSDVDEQDAAVLAIMATAYVARMRKNHRPEWLIQAFLRLVRTMRAALLGPLYQFLSTQSVHQASGALATNVARYVAQQLPDADPPKAVAAVTAFRQALGTAVQTATMQLTGQPLAQRMALILPAETQILTADLTRQAAGTVPSILRTASPTACKFCLDLAGRYDAPYAPELWRRTHAARVPGAALEPQRPQITNYPSRLTWDGFSHVPHVYRTVKTGRNDHAREHRPQSGTHHATRQRQWRHTPTRAGPHRDLHPGAGGRDHQ